MSFKIISPSDYIIRKWSGGTTTQLFIDPSTADYAKKDFNFRLSTATVEVEKSDFTSLPGISRKIMVLDGMIKIQHDNHYTKTLNKFDTDTFKGDWKTSAIGTCTDFNLMTTGNTHGDISALTTNKNKINELNISSCDFFFIYMYKGFVSLNVSDNEVFLPFSNMLMINNSQPIQLRLKSHETSELILITVKLLP
ncbi:MAG: HutD family protein [Bacteroidales bacterium]|nr:HutD family protein [Bacteroidales bacterium]